MNTFTAYLFGEKNYEMLGNIITKKIFEKSGLEVDTRDDFLLKTIDEVANSVVRSQIRYIREFNDRDLIKLNNMIIKECVNYMLKLINDDKTRYSSMIDDIDSDEEQMVSTTPEPVVIQKQELKPHHRLHLEVEF